MDAVEAAAVEYIRRAFEGGISDAPDGTVGVNAEDDAFKALVTALRAMNYIPPFGPETDAWVRGA